MNLIERKQVAEAIFQHCMEVMEKKGTEYSRGEQDCLSNFKRVAEALGLDPIQVAWIYTLKHIDSISSWVKTRATPSGEPIEGRITDAINYLLILASLIEETKGTPFVLSTCHTHTKFSDPCTAKCFESA